MAGLNVQIFGVRNSPATRAAERFFKERRIGIHYVDLRKKPLAPGEIRRFSEKFGGLASLLDPESKEYVDAGLKYLRLPETELFARIERTPGLLRLPLVRGPGSRLAVGSDPDAWKAMLEL